MEKPDFGEFVRRPTTKWLEDGLRRESATIIRRKDPREDSHFYCLTSEGPKSLYDADVADILISEEEVIVEYRPGEYLAYPCTEVGALRRRMGKSLRDALMHPMRKAC